MNRVCCPVLNRLSEMEIIATPQGGSKLIYNDHLYIVKKKANGWIRWNCTKAKSDNCKGALTTDDPVNPAVNPRSIKAHNYRCLPSGVQVEVARFRNDMKESATQNVGAKTAQIITTGLQNLSAEALLETPQMSTLRRDVQRQKAKSRPMEPTTIQQIHLQHPWNSTGGANPVPFFIHDTGPAAGGDEL